MRRALNRLAIPGTGIGVASASVAIGRAQGMIPDAMEPLLWQGIIILGLLALSATAAWILPRRRWYWVAPLVAAAIAQIIGSLRYLAGTYEHWGETVFGTILTFLLVLAVVVTYWLFDELKRGWQESRIWKERDADSVPQDELKRLRADFREAVRKLKKKHGRDALYRFPWILITGETGGGKTESIKSPKDLGLPAGDDWKGRGGTRRLDFFFTDYLIFLDTPGEWVDYSHDEKSKKMWRSVIGELRKWHGRFPLDGIIVVVPVDKLLEDGDNAKQELVAKAERIRELMYMFQEELRLRLPIYLVVSKMDLVQGFRDFFEDLKSEQQQAMMGWSERHPDDVDPERTVRIGMGRLTRRLEDYRLEGLGRYSLDTAPARRLLFFPEEFKRIVGPLAAFSGVLFHRDQEREPIPLRGVYLTSAMQEGNPLGKVIEELTRVLGVESVDSGKSETGRKSYFLRDFFIHHIINDRGLAGRSVGYWFKRWRDTALVGFMPAVVAVVLLAWSLLAFSLNASLFKQVGEEVPKLEKELAESMALSLGQRMMTAIPVSEKLRDFHRQLDEVSLARGFGMRRTAGLQDVVLGAYRKAFLDHVLGPTMDEAKERLENSESSLKACSEKFRLLDGLLALAETKTEREPDLAPLKPIESLWSISEEDEELLLKKLVLQYKYLRRFPTVDGSTAVLPGFPLEEAVSDIAKTCGASAGDSSLGRYKQWLESCLPEAGVDTEQCLKELEQDVLDYDEKAASALRAGVEGVEERLKRLRRVDPAAGDALKALEQGLLAEREECLSGFEQHLLPALREFVKQCRGAVANCTGGDGGPKVPQEEDAGGNCEAASIDVGELTVRCAERIPREPLAGFLQKNRWEVCLGQAGFLKPSPTPKESAPDPVVGKLVRFAPVKPSYSEEGCRKRKGRWQSLTRLADRAGTPDAIRSELQTVLNRDRGPYCTRFRAAWKAYAADLKIKAPSSGGELSPWLKNLSESEELENALTPWRLADQACSNCAAAAAPSVNALDTYKQHLQQVADEWKAAETSPAALEDLKRCVVSDEGSCQWKRARGFVGEHFSGALKGNLMVPLNRLKGKLAGINPAKDAWKRLVEQYEEVKDRFPVKAGVTVPAAGAKKLHSLLGGEGSTIATLEGLFRDRLTPKADRWLEHVKGVGDALFAHGTDEWQQFEIGLSVLQARTESRVRGFRPTSLIFKFGSEPEAEIKWSLREKARAAMGDMKTMLFSLDPTDDTPVSLKLNYETRATIWQLGERLRGWQPKSLELGGKKERWSVLRLLADSCVPMEDEQTLKCTFVKDLGKVEDIGKEGKLEVQLKVSGDELMRAWDDLRKIVKEGIPPPPQEGMSNE